MREVWPSVNSRISTVSRAMLQDPVQHCQIGQAGGFLSPTVVIIAGSFPSSPSCRGTSKKSTAFGLICFNSGIPTRSTADTETACVSEPPRCDEKDAQTARSVPCRDGGGGAVESAAGADCSALFQDGTGRRLAAAGAGDDIGGVVPADLTGLLGASSPFVLGVANGRCRWLLRVRCRFTVSLLNARRDDVIWFPTVAPSALLLSLQPPAASAVPPTHPAPNPVPASNPHSRAGPMRSAPDVAAM